MKPGEAERLQSSGLTSPIGLGILLALFLLSAYFRVTAAESVLAVLLLLCLVSYLWARFSLRRVEVALEGGDCRAFPGELMQVRAGLYNRKFLPLIWLDARFPCGENPCVSPEEEGEESVGERFAWIMPHQRLSWTQTARAMRRGVCRVDGMGLSSGDGFGLTTRYETAPLPAPFRFVVYPEIIPVDPSIILRNMSRLETSEQGFYPDNTLIRTIRPYQEGDSFRDINWRLLARQVELQVNMREKLSMRRVCFVPDLESWSYLEQVTTEEGTGPQVRLHSRELERAISLIASLILRLQEQKVLCSLVVPGFGDTAARIVIPTDRSTQGIELLTALAELDYPGGPARLPFEEMDAGRHLLGQPFVLSYDLARREVPGPLEELAPLRIVQETGGEDAPLPPRTYKEADFIGL